MQSDSNDPNRWVELYADRLFAFAYSRLRNRDTAEEVVQETFLAALRNRDQFRHESDLGGWLMGILKRKVIDRHRSRMKQPVSLDSDQSFLDGLFDASGHWSSAAMAAKAVDLDTLEQAEFQEMLKKCLDRLPEQQASAFILREIDDESTDNVCKELEITPSNLWVLIHRARLRLAECLRARWAMGA